MIRYSEIDKIKLKVLEEVARLTLNDELKERIDELPYRIIDKDQPICRCCIHHERAVVADKIRLAIGLSRQKSREYERLSDAVDQTLTLERIEEPVIEVIESACDACPIDRFMVTDACRNCMAHACQDACPRQAIVIVGQRAHIDQDRCIECGKCAQECPFHAIVEVIRPCMKACAVGAIQGHRGRKTVIDYRKCVSCGNCVRACPFGAIVEKSEIVQVISQLKKNLPVYAAVAPSFIGQFGRKVSPELLRAAFLKIGFTDMVEVAVGADLVTLNEAQEFVEDVPDKKSFAINSCCTSFRFLIEKEYSELKDNLFDSLPPMIVTGQIIKAQEPGARVIFIGPCLAKKVEALHGEGRRVIDGVLTFEEMLAIFRAAGIDFTSEDTLKDILMEKERTSQWESSRVGRLFARTGGVTEALISTIKKLAPNKNVESVRAEGLKDCDKLLRTAKTGKLKQNFIEGMACLGGCIGGPGTFLKEVVATKMVNDYSQKAKYFYSFDNPCIMEWKVESKDCRINNR